MHIVAINITFKFDHSISKPYHVFRHNHQRYMHMWHTKLVMHVILCRGVSYQLYTYYKLTNKHNPVELTKTC